MRWIYRKSRDQLFPEVTSVTWQEVTSPEFTWPEEDLTKPEVIACACVTGTVCTTTIAVAQHVVQYYKYHDYRKWPKITWWGFPPYFRLFWPEMTLPVGGYPDVRMHNRKLGFLPFFRVFFFFLFIFQFVFNFCISFFCHSIFTSNKANFFTMSVASKGDGSKSPVTSVMLCPAHNWIR